MKFRHDYSVNRCKECNLTFLVPIFKMKQMRRRPYCPMCGENLYSEHLRNASIEDPEGHKRRYTKEDVDDLIEYNKRGYSYKEMAKAMGRTPEAIRGKLNRMYEKGELK